MYNGNHEDSISKKHMPMYLKVFKINGDHFEAYFACDVK